MGTHATIAYAEKTEKETKVSSIYVHWDGYIDYAGKILAKHYTAPERIQELIALGDLSSIAENIQPDSERPHTFDDPQKGVCVAYYRDRGEPWTQSKAHEQIYTQELNIEKWSKNQEQYAYLFIDGTWYVNGVPLQQEIETKSKKEN